jgi:hypothetical protein
MRGEGGGVGVAGCQPMSTAVRRSPNKLSSNSIFNLCVELTDGSSSSLSSLYILPPWFSSNATNAVVLRGLSTVTGMRPLALPD